MKMRTTIVAIASLIACGLVQAQIATNPNAKVDPKNNKVSRPVVEKPKQKLLTRDELRACMVGRADNEAEGKKIKEEEAQVTAQRTAVLAEKEELTKRGNEIAASLNQLKSERDALIKSGEDAKANAAKMTKDELKAAQEAYQAKAVELDKRIEAHNKTKDTYISDSQGFDAKVEAYNKRKDELATRVDKYLETVDEWRTSCQNKAYDELDEKAIKKELDAKAAAGQAK